MGRTKQHVTLTQFNTLELAVAALLEKVEVQETQIKTLMDEPSVLKTLFEDLPEVEEDKVEEDKTTKEECAVLNKHHLLYRATRGPRTYTESHPAYGLKNVFYMDKGTAEIDARKICPTCVSCSDNVQKKSKCVSYFECRCE